MKKQTVVILIMLTIILSATASAELLISPKEPVINGNNYVLIIYYNSSLNNTNITLNISSPSSEIKTQCNITLNEYGYGLCKYNFTSTDVAGAWAYSTNTSANGTFDVGKINIQIKDMNNLSSIKYGEKTNLEITFDYEKFLPKEIFRYGISRDLGQHSSYHDVVDIDGDGKKEIVIVDYNGYIFIWKNISRLVEGVPLIAGIDFRTNDMGVLYSSSGCAFGDFDNNGIQTMICPDNSGILRAWPNVNITNGTSVSARFNTTDDGAYRSSPAICDVTGDEIPDQVAIGTYEGPIIIFTYNDASGFTKIYTSSDWGAVNQDTAPVCADFDGDGYNEWIITEGATGNYFVNTDNSNISNVSLGDQADDRGNYIGGAVADFDGDGKIEFITPVLTGNLQLLEFNKSGTNILEEDIAWLSDTDYTDFSFSSGKIQIDDLNKNGRPDFMIVGAINQPPLLFYEYNPLTSGWTQIMVFQNIVEQSLSVPAYVDFDGDGIKEVMVFARYSGNTYIFKFNGETWDLIYKGWEYGAEDFFSGEGLLYAPTPVNGWLYSNCATDDFDADGREEAICTPYDGNMFYYEQADNYEHNVSPKLYLELNTNDGHYKKIDDIYTDIRLMGDNTTLCVKNNVAFNINDSVDEDNQNQGNIATRWTDAVFSTEEYYMATQLAVDYATLDASTIEEAVYSRIKLPRTYKSGKVVIWNYYSDGRSFENVIIKTTSDNSSALCNWTSNTTIFDNSPDGNNERYSENYKGKIIYFNPEDIACLRESTSGSDYYTTANNNANLRTELQIFETEEQCNSEISMNKRNNSTITLKNNLTINVTAYDRTGKIVNITSSLNIPVTWNALPFSTVIVGGTEYYPGQEGQIIIQLKDEFNDPVIGAACTVDYYYPNMTLWLNDQDTSELSGTGIYYDSFTLPPVDGVYVSFVNCTSGTFSDTDSHTFHVSGILLSINSTVANISQVVSNINQTISTTILASLSEINSTSSTAYNYMQNTIYPALEYLNSTSNDLMLKWGTYNASYIYEKINYTASLANNTNNNTLSLLSKWGTYTAETIYSLINNTYNRTLAIQQEMATAENISVISSNLSWILSNAATQSDINEIISGISDINNSIVSVENSLSSVLSGLESTNSSMSQGFENIYSNLTWLAGNAALSSDLGALSQNVSSIMNATTEIANTLSNAATQQNITSLLAILNIISENLSTQQNITAIIGAVSGMNNAIGAAITSINNTVLAANASISSGLSGISGNLSLIEQSMVTQNNITSAMTALAAISGNMSTQQNITELIAEINLLENTLAEIDSALSGINLTLLGVNNSIYTINTSLSSGIENINSNITIIRTNAATQQNITTIYGNLSWLYTNVATQQNISGISSGLAEISSNIEQINSTVNTVRQNLLSINSSIENLNSSTLSALDAIQQNLSWLAENAAMQSNITSLQTGIEWLVSNSGNSNFTEILNAIESINESTNEISAIITEINSTIYNVNWSIDGIYASLGNLNASIQSSISDIQNNITIIAGNMALQENITSILDAVANLAANISSGALEDNNSSLIEALQSLNSSINNAITSINQVNSTVAAGLSGVNNSLNEVNSNLSQIIINISAGETNDGLILARISGINSTLENMNNYISQNITSSLTTINNTVSGINDYVTGVLAIGINDINSSVRNISDLLPPGMNESLSNILSEATGISATISSDVVSRLISIGNSVSYINTTTAVGLASGLFSLNQTLEILSSFVMEDIYNSINYTSQNISSILSLIGTSEDNESAETIFGEQKYTILSINQLTGNITLLNNRISSLNISMAEINLTLSDVLGEIYYLEELHQCNFTNTSICNMLYSISNDTQEIYALLTNFSGNFTLSGSLFSITSLVAGSPRYANEEVLVEATFSGQNGSAVIPAALNITIYDPNGNIWSQGNKGNFSAIGNVWEYSSSISSNPTTGMYTAHLTGTYEGVEASRIVQFRIATGGPYKVYLDCPSTATAGVELNCTILIQDEGEAATESISTVWLDTNNNGAYDFGETQVSFSKETQPLQTILETVSLNLPSSHVPGLYLVRVETAYVNSAQPNSQASDSVIISNAANNPSSGGGSRSSRYSSASLSPANQSANLSNSITGQAISDDASTNTEPSEIVCSLPYIRHGAECCLDYNSDQVCDRDEMNILSGIPEEKQNKSAASIWKELKNSPTVYLLAGTASLIILFSIILLTIVLSMPGYVRRMKNAILIKDHEEDRQHIIYTQENDEKNIKEEHINKQKEELIEQNLPEKESAENNHMTKQTEKAAHQENIDKPIRIKEAQETERFFLSDGRILSTLEELSSALLTMSSETFIVHVNESKNDFSNWIKGVFREDILAEEIRQIKDKTTMSHIIKGYIS